MPALVNCELTWSFLVTGTEDLFAGMSRLKTRVPEIVLSNFLIRQLFLDSNLTKKIWYMSTDLYYSS